MIAIKRIFIRMANPSVTELKKVIEPIIKPDQLPEAKQEQKQVEKKPIGRTRANEIEDDIRRENEAYAAETKRLIVVKDAAIAEANATYRQNNEALIIGHKKELERLNAKLTDAKVDKHKAISISAVSTGSFISIVKDEVDFNKDPFVFTLGWAYEGKFRMFYGVDGTQKPRYVRLVKGKKGPEEYAFTLCDDDANAALFSFEKVADIDSRHFIAFIKCDDSYIYAGHKMMSALKMEKIKFGGKEEKGGKNTWTITIID